MRVNCEGCAGCCIDWRAISPVALDHERRGPRQPLDDVYNLVPLRRDEVRRFIDAGYGDALVPRLFQDANAADSRVTIDGIDLAAIDGGPAFFVGLRKPPKPVGPFDTEATWLSTCVFLDPETLQCRIHDSDLYPEECSVYPGYNLALDVETECERVESTFGGERLIDRTPTEAKPLFGRHAIGEKVFVHPEPARLEGVVSRLAAREPTDEDRAELLAVAAASSAGTTVVNDGKYETAREQVLAADSWTGRAIDDWTERAGDPGDSAPASRLARTVELARGAPDTPGWAADN
ncbi:MULTISPECIES: YkgJ family cysteine cluster protein [unclassified Haladaptatus]|uniref:YkgJ family cysteine cluster protein n=1 Tax=unclassified Haladaptatus TaxID=2622732 RepID=UPI0023E786EA|nr:MULTISPECIES: YkgJ family cysteine cluster protein [unclassified Haladaptatus]